jgi:hypothetical protein
MKKLVQIGKVLSKDHQRKILGGDYGAGGSCIYCIAQGGACGGGVGSCWYRTNPDPSACATIYSGCSSGIGWVGECGSGCTMN